MLIVCAQCGRPVYRKAAANRIQCPYCYKYNMIPFVPLDVRKLPWQRPLLRAAEEKTDFQQALTLLDRLGEYEPAKEMRAQLIEKEERRVSDILLKIGGIIDGAEFRSQLTEAFYLLDTVPRTGRTEALREALNRKLSEIQAQEDRRAVENLRFQLERMAPVTDWSLEWAIEDTKEIAAAAEKLAHVPAAEEVVREAAERGAVFRAELDRRIAEAKRRKRMRVLAGILLASAVILGCAGWYCYDVFVLQPAELERARRSAAEKDYFDAAEAYQALEGR